MTKSALALVLAVVAALVAWLALKDASEERAAATPAEVAKSAEKQALEPTTQLAHESERVEELASDANDAHAPQESASEPSSAPAESQLITLYGFVRPAAGSRELRGEVHVSIVDHLGASQLAEASPDGAYSISGLAPGKYWIRAGSSRNGNAQARVELDERESERRLDLQLARDPEVLVKVVDRAGEPMNAFDLLAIATREPPGEWFEEVHGSQNNPFGVGRFQQNGFASDRLADVYLGRVLLDVPPPVFVSVVRYQRVIATQRVELGTSEIEFVLDRDSALLQPASVRLRFVDAASGAPVVSSLAMLNGSSTLALRPVDGVFGARKVAPGWYEFVATANGYERSHRRLLVEPGIENDFGAITLERELTLDAFVVDETGQGVAARFALERYDALARKPMRSPVGFVFDSDSSGRLHIGGLSRATYALQHRDQKSPWGWKTKLVDLSAGSIGDLRIELARGVPLVLQPSDEVSSEARFTIFDDAGSYVTSSRLPSDAPRPIPLAPGRYEIEVRVGDAEPRRIPVTIGAEPVELALP